MAHVDESNLISLYEKFWNCKIRNGFVKIEIKGVVVVSQIAEMVSLTGSSYDKLVKLSTKDLFGNKIPQTNFKLSELKGDTSEIPLLLTKSK